MPHKKTEKNWELQERKFTEKKTEISKENSVGRNILS